MRDVCFIADVAVLPRWIRVSQALDYVAGVHPRFDRAKAEGFLARTTIAHGSKVRELSKGMVTQLHLALVMAIDARLLVLDEPTLGLDLLFRKQFYDALLDDYFDRSRTIVVATHQVEEVQHVLTDLLFIDRGRIVFDRSDGGGGGALPRGAGAARAARGGAGAQADARAPGLRPQHHAVRRRRPRSSSPRWARCARPALPTCSWPWWAVRGGEHEKEPRDEHDCHARRAFGRGDDPDRSAALLVGAVASCGSTARSTWHRWPSPH